jgi:hydroxymethylglutaryl-CoA lyase
MLHGMGMETNIDMNGLVETGNWISEKLGRPTNSRAGAALMAAAKRRMELATKAELNAKASKL